MAQIFAEIPGMTQIMTQSDLKKYLLGVDALPDYKASDYSEYRITEDARGRSSKLYFVKQELEKGGYAFVPYSHYELTLDDHIGVDKFFEFSYLKPVEIASHSVVGGKLVLNYRVPMILGYNTVTRKTTERETRRDTSDTTDTTNGISKTWSDDESAASEAAKEMWESMYSYSESNKNYWKGTRHVLLNQDAEYYRRRPQFRIDEETDEEGHVISSTKVETAGSIEKLSLEKLKNASDGKTVDGYWIRALGTVTLKVTNSTNRIVYRRRALEATATSEITITGSTTVTIDGKTYKVSDGSLTVAIYEAYNNCELYIPFIEALGSGMRTGWMTPFKLEHCGGYLYEVDRSNTLYNINLTDGTIAELHVNPGVKLDGLSFEPTTDSYFKKNKTYYVAKDVASGDKGAPFGSYEAIPATDYSIGSSISTYLKLHPEYKEVYILTSSKWIQTEGFVGTLNTSRDWYERVGSKFPYEGFVAVVTEKGDGQQRGGIYQCAEQKYLLTEDDVHHSWNEQGSRVSKSYFEFHEDTGTYVERDGSSKADGRVYRLPTTGTFFGECVDVEFAADKAYYLDTEGKNQLDTSSLIGTTLADWRAAHPNEEIYDPFRACYSRGTTKENRWRFEDITKKFGVTTDTEFQTGKQYYYHNSAAVSYDKRFETIEDGSRFYLATDVAVGYYTSDKTNPNDIWTNANKTKVFIYDSNIRSVRTIKDYIEDMGITTDADAKTEIARLIAVGTKMLEKFEEGRQPLYYCVVQDKAKTGTYGSRFQEFTIDNTATGGVNYEGVLINSIPNILYYKHTDLINATKNNLDRVEKEIPTEIPTYVEFGKYNGQWDGVNIPDIEEADTVYLESMMGEPLLPDEYYEQCYGMFVWKQFFIDRSIAIEKCYDIDAFYLPGDRLLIRWKDPKFLLDKDDVSTTPDAWYRTTVELEATSLMGNAITLWVEGDSTDTFGDDFLVVDLKNPKNNIGVPIDKNTLEAALAEGARINFTVVGQKGRTSTTTVCPQEVVYQYDMTYKPLTGASTSAVACPGFRYFKKVTPLTGDPYYEEVVDVIPYVTPVDNYFVQVQMNQAVFEKVTGTENYLPVVIGPNDDARTAGYCRLIPGDYIGGQSGAAYYALCPTKPQIRLIDLLRKGVLPTVIGDVGARLSSFTFRVDFTTAGSVPTVNSIAGIAAFNNVNLAQPIEYGYMTVREVYNSIAGTLGNLIKGSSAALHVFRPYQMSEYEPASGSGFVWDLVEDPNTKLAAVFQQIQANPSNTSIGTDVFVPNITVAKFKYYTYDEATRTFNAFNGTLEELQRYRENLYKKVRYQVDGKFVYEKVEIPTTSMTLVFPDLTTAAGNMQFCSSTDATVLQKGWRHSTPRALFTKVGQDAFYRSAFFREGMIPVISSCALYRNYRVDFDEDGAMTMSDVTNYSDGKTHADDVVDVMWTPSGSQLGLQSLEQTLDGTFPYGMPVPPEEGGPLDLYNVLKQSFAYDRQRTDRWDRTETIKIESRMFSGGEASWWTRTIPAHQVTAYDENGSNIYGCQHNSVIAMDTAAPVQACTCTSTRKVVFMATFA